VKCPDHDGDRVTNLVQTLKEQIAEIIRRIILFFVTLHRVRPALSRR